MSFVRFTDERLRFGGEWRRDAGNSDEWRFWRRLGLDGPLVETCIAHFGTPRLQRPPDASRGTISHAPLDIAAGV